MTASSRVRYPVGVPHLPTAGILPPHILWAIVANGDAEQRAWALQALAVSERIRGRRELLGDIATAAAAAAPGKQRTVYDAKHGSQLPGAKARGEGDPPGKDVAVNEAYDGAGATYDLYHEVFGRDSIDDRGMPLLSTVHYRRGYDNAFWDGSQMVYGDGDGKIFGRFTKAVDVIGHELTHGVTQYEANLDYADQPGALNESVSDVFGSLVKQRTLGQTAGRADWLIGAGLFTPAIRGVALRSMAAPGTAYDDPLIGSDPQPADMAHYVETADDNGGVHINSGIPNRAFYLAAVAIGGFAWETTGRVWYVTLRDRLRPTSDFRAAANLTIAVARELFGARGAAAKAVAAAWAEVGVL
ncbi:MAG: M4 family metallopeptidase [Thermoanaerobaculaceae bacterium]|nr:M4 family metallopeptidase [Thermoanaerobaculaceae bacterium]